MDRLSALWPCMACVTCARQVAGRAQADYCFLSFPLGMVFPKSSRLVLRAKLREKSSPTHLFTVTVHRLNKIICYLQLKGFSLDTQLDPAVAKMSKEECILTGSSYRNYIKPIFACSTSVSKYFLLKISFCHHVLSVLIPFPTAGPRTAGYKESNT